MRKILYLLAGAFLFNYMPVTLAAPVTPLDKIIAIVNDDVITNNELHQALTVVSQQASQQGMSLPPQRVLKEQVLEQLINKKLQLQLASQTGINVSQTELNQTIQRIAEQNQMQVKEFYQRIAQDGLTKTAYLQEMREQLIIQKLQQQEIMSRIVITPEEIATYSKRLSQDQPHRNQSYHLQDILIPLTDEPSPQELKQAQQQAAAILQQLKKGKSVQAATRSTTKTKPRINDLGMRALSEIPTPYVKAIAELNAHDIAGPIQTGNGLHLLRILATKSQPGSAERPNPQQIENMLGQKKLEDELQSWLTKARNQAYIVNKLHEQA